MKPAGAMGQALSGRGTRWGPLLTASSGAGAGRSARVILRRTPGFCWFQSAKAAWPVTVWTCPDWACASRGAAAGSAREGEGKEFFHGGLGVFVGDGLVERMVSGAGDWMQVPAPTVTFVCGSGDHGAARVSDIRGW